MTRDELVRRFSYHAPKGGQAAKYEAIRGTAFGLAEVIEELCPESREKNLAFTKLEECVMHANSAIARREKVEEDDGAGGVTFEVTKDPAE